MKYLKVIVIVGPTGVGKTETSIEIAQKLGGEIVSADSMQIYRGMDILTAKPSKEEMALVPHHMIDIADVFETFSAAKFAKEATKCIDDILQRGKLPVIVGGTGLYVDSLLGEYSFGKIKSDGKIREKYEKIALEKGNEYLHSLLKDIDPKSYETIHFNNVKRVIRALEIYEITGKSQTENNAEKKKTKPKYDAVKICLTRDRQKLYERIDMRVDQMLKNGLVNEVKLLYNGKKKLSETAYSAIGCKEIIYYLKGLATYDETVSILKRESRRYAKRQLTWFKKSENLPWFDMDKCTKEDILKFVQKEISQ